MIKNKRIGILGGGQLARMLALAAYPMGYSLSCIDPTPQPCASDVIPCINAPYTDWEILDNFIQQCDVITYENENIPLEVATYINQRKPLHPSPLILHHSQDRLLEKQFLQQLGIATAPFMAINNWEELQLAVTQLGLPLILKSRRFGYDGKGQYFIRNSADLSQLSTVCSANSLIAESVVNFDSEVSLIAVRNNAQMVFYSLTCNKHQAGILQVSTAPFAEIKLQQQAQQIAATILSSTDYIGVLAIEFFNLNGTLLVNEIAPRVHNSGHWTIEGANVSQFANHVRAICNLPLGNTDATGYSAMFNCIGSMPDIDHILAIPATYLHDYAKQPRPLRKVGHITLHTTDAIIYKQSLQQLMQLFNYSL